MNGESIWGTWEICPRVRRVQDRRQVGHDCCPVLPAAAVCSDIKGKFSPLLTNTHSTDLTECQGL